MQAVVKAAQDVYVDENAGTDEVDKATKSLDTTDKDSALSKAIADLIPTSQVNPTGLYETLNLYSAEDAKDYSLDSWTAFARKRDEAQKLLDSLFTKDEKGNVIATAENSSAKHPQETVDALIKALKDA